MKFSTIVYEGLSYIDVTTIWENLDEHVSFGVSIVFSKRQLYCCLEVNNIPLFWHRCSALTYRPTYLLSYLLTSGLNHGVTELVTGHFFKTQPKPKFLDPTQHNPQSSSDPTQPNPSSILVMAY